MTQEGCCFAPFAPQGILVALCSHLQVVPAVKDDQEAYLIEFIFSLYCFLDLTFQTLA